MSRFGNARRYRSSPNENRQANSPKYLPILPGDDDCLVPPSIENADALATDSSVTVELPASPVEEKTGGLLNETHKSGVHPIISGETSPVVIENIVSRYLYKQTPQLHPGKALLDCLEALQISVASVADGLGVTRQQLYNVINGKSNITPDMAARLEAAFGCSADDWLALQTCFDLPKARARVRSQNISRMRASSPKM